MGINYQVLIGDCVESMRQLEAGSVQCCVTSPPYFGLRDYGHDGQIGLEPTPDEFVAALVRVFSEVHRVLADDGTLWLNLGDSYASYRDAKCVPNTVGGGQKSMPKQGAANRSAATFRDTPIKHKDLIGIPWRVAFALQSAGWYLRQDIIWHKPNPMPESVRDRCTKAHEYIFLLTKSARYFYDAGAVKETSVYPAGRDNRSTARANPAAELGKGDTRHAFGHVSDGTRNRRSVWTVTTKPYKGAHFATFPPDLIEPCILAGCPEGGTVLDPFGGSGTTAGVAVKHGRQAIICELNPDYAALIPDRIASIAPQSDQLDMFGGDA